MRDIVRDAAIVTMAREYYHANTPLDSFLDMYEDKESKNPDYAKDLLYDLNLIEETYDNSEYWDGGQYMFNSRYVWVWNEEKF